MSPGDGVIRRRVIISGRVQGVFYRASCRDRAHDLGVNGWVHNRLDGRVEAVFEGPPAAVEALVAWCKTGPRGAFVTSVETTLEVPSGETGFDVV